MGKIGVNGEKELEMGQFAGQRVDEFKRKSSPLFPGSGGLENCNFWSSCQFCKPEPRF